MKKFAILSLIAAISIFTSCEKDPVLGVSVKEISAPFSGNETSVVITANNPWVVQGNEWCVVDPASGEAGEFTVTLKVKPNETYDPRECDVKVSSSGLTEVIKVIQAVQHVIQTEAAEFNLSGEEQLLTLSVQSNTDIQVGVSAEWIQFEEIKGLASNNLIFNVQENQTTSKREADITIKNNEGDVSINVKVCQYALRAYLPDGFTFCCAVDEFMSGKGIARIKFITNSDTISDDALVEGSIYLVKNDETLEIHTSSSQFVANSSCNNMFDAHEGWDDSTQQSIYNSFRKIQTIDFGDNFNTQNVTDMGSMFSFCSSLTSLDLSNFDTQNVINMENMFNECTSLTSLDVSNFDTQKVTNMFHMFYNCSGLTSLDVRNFNTQNVTNMSLMFSYCSGLTSLDVRNFNTQNVTDMSYMFQSCSSFTLLDLSNFDTQNVINMENMFNECTSLTSLDVSNFDTQNVTYMRFMFFKCSSLTSLDLSNFNTQNVTDMGCMFDYCSNLTSLDLSNFDTQNVINMNEMFRNCTSLTSLDVSNFDTQNVTSMFTMFCDCSSLTSLDLSSFSFSASLNIDGMFTNTGKDAANKPIWIYVTTEAKQYIVNSGRSGLDNEIAKLVVEGVEGNFISGDLGETDGGNW